jgi:PHP family Zn ribbon phosphoesterase
MADLHIHSTLSPCGSLEMSPKKIVERAKILGINFISITDHNAIKNSEPTKNLAEKYGISYIYGMEVQTEEEVHILTYFDNYSDLSNVWALVYEKLPNIENKPDYFGDQVMLDEEENILGFEKKLLLNSSKISLEELCKIVLLNHGIAIPAHIDSPSFSILSQIGIIPEYLFLPFLEISYAKSENDIINRYPFLKDQRFVSFSDAHYLNDIGRACTLFEIETPNISEIKLSANNASGRKTEIIRRLQ